MPLNLYKMMQPAIVLCLMLFSIKCHGFETNELQMFDLVEDVKMSFYEFIGVEKDANNADIRKAYRKLSLVMHPDKNPNDPEAETQFRRLTSIYSILKDDELREKYNNILEHGLPDWRQPVFYYRQLRKMSTIEILLVTLLMAGFIHYSAIWGMTYERRWNMSESLAQQYKRHKKPASKRRETDQQIKRDLDENMPLPGFWDILPFAFFRWIKMACLAIPLLFRQLRASVQEQKEENMQKADVRKQLERQRAQERILKSREMENRNPSTYTVPAESLTQLFPNLQDLDNKNEGTKQETIPEGEIPLNTWHEDDIKLLITLINKFPVGLANRWDKIAKKIQRPEAMVVAKARELQQEARKATEKKILLQKLTEQQQKQAKVESSSFTTGFEVHENKDSSNSCDSENELEAKKTNVKRSAKTGILPPPTENYENQASMLVDDEESDGFVKLTVDDEHKSRKKMKINKNQLKETDSNRMTEDVASEQNLWSQAQQKMLEIAIKSIPDGTEKRWDQIAECVEGKTKEEVIKRAKHLSQLCKNKS